MCKVQFCVLRFQVPNIRFAKILLFHRFYLFSVETSKHLFVLINSPAQTFSYTIPWDIVWSLLLYYRSPLSFISQELLRYCLSCWDKSNDYWIHCWVNCHLHTLFDSSWFDPVGILWNQRGVDLLFLLALWIFDQEGLIFLGIKEHLANYCCQ